MNGRGSVCWSTLNKGRSLNQTQQQVKDFLWHNLGFLRRVTRESGKIGGLAMTYVCAHCKHFPREDFFWWVTTGQKGRNKKAKKKYSGWWCANCGEPYAWRGVNGIVIMQAGSTEEDQKIICAQGHPQGEVENVTAALRIVTKLQDTEGKQHFEVLSHGCGERFAESWRKFVSVDNARTIMSWKRKKQGAVVRRVLPPNIEHLK